MDDVQLGSQLYVVHPNPSISFIFEIRNAKSEMVKHLPNLITLLNLLAGSAAIVALLQADYLLAFWLLFVAVFADFFDGLAARLLGVHSALGEQLD
jgi:phosphatidylserine synthase